LVDTPQIMRRCNHFNAEIFFSATSAGLCAAGCELWAARIPSVAALIAAAIMPATSTGPPRLRGGGATTPVPLLPPHPLPVPPLPPIPPPSLATPPLPPPWGARALARTGWGRGAPPCATVVPLTGAWTGGTRVVSRGLPSNRPPTLVGGTCVSGTVADRPPRGGRPVASAFWRKAQPWA
jgi:hypothetical protein